MKACKGVGREEKKIMESDRCVLIKFTSSNLLTFVHSPLVPICFKIKDMLSAKAKDQRIKSSLCFPKAMTRKLAKENGQKMVIWNMLIVP